ncbi:MAG: aminotransferase class V-fold PLP-dependent enzyme [Clostridium sp.]|uniref:aminotransferase class I/II-fold pyridoxal phosphate-dependent enzyme n=1 Tax=Clostridium sp. TaxID=1506 RepID=UPI003040409C
MSRLPIIDALMKYSEEKYDYFAMPGHKMGKGFNNTIEGNAFFNNLINYDITEVDGLDNLHQPTGIIKEAQDYLSEYYQSKKSYFLVNGSTSGNMIMIFSTFNEGDKIIVERNCHKSVFNSIILRKLNPVYIKNEVSEKYDAPFSINKEHLFQVIEENKDAKGILLTYPNYYGICFDINEIIDRAKEYNIKVLVDCAHGAHFGVIEELPENPVKLGCDMVVHSAHKTLHSLTQTSFLHVNSNELLEQANFYTGVFSTTSPSYIFLASMDYSRYYLDTYGIVAYKELIELCETYRIKINSLGFYHIIDETDIELHNKRESLNVLIDKTRYVINVPKGFSGHKLLEYLLINKIQCEMSDDRNVVLIFSTTNDVSDFERLYNVLRECTREFLKCEYIKPIKYDLPEVKKLPWETLNMKKKQYRINDSLNKICGQAIIPYPPGIPLIMPGELISKYIIDIIYYYQENNVTLLGIDDNNIYVLEND